jgi:serine/threonine-protein kinase
MDTILDFHYHVETLGFVAVDFYDGCIMYDFAAGETRICDVDLYQPKPYRNPMGRMWGSSRFMSPEEFELGAVIDERTNVFTMGAAAFLLLGGGIDRAFEKWEAGRGLYGFALRAVSPDRAARWASVREMKEAWDGVGSD